MYLKMSRSLYNIESEGSRYLTIVFLLKSTNHITLHIVLQFYQFSIMIYFLLSCICIYSPGEFSWTPRFKSIGLRSSMICLCSLGRRYFHQNHMVVPVVATTAPQTVVISVMAVRDIPSVFLRGPTSGGIVAKANYNLASITPIVT